MPSVDVIAIGSIATKEGKPTVIAVDHEVAKDEVHTSPLILYIYKISEMKVDLPIFIALPRLSENARKIAKGQDILVIEGLPEDPAQIAQLKAEIEARIRAKTPDQIQTEPAAATEAKTEKAPSFMKMLKRLKPSKNIEYPATPFKASEETQTRNMVFLLDGSSSMRKGKGNISNFEVASKAIENVLTNPNPTAKDDRLSIIVFWSEFMIGFQKQVLYESVPMSEKIDPQRLNKFEKPKKYVGTPVWEGVEYATEFLKGKNGKRIIKLITDAVEIPQPKDNTIINILTENSIQLDCLIVGSEGNMALARMIRNANLGRFFESSNVESLALALKA